MIHKFTLNGLYIVLDVNSGGVHIVDEMTYDLLDDAKPPFADECPAEILEKLSGKYEADELKECYLELKSLYEEKILFSEDDYEKYAAFAVASPIKAMCLHIAHDCNLRCTYCFASAKFSSLSDSSGCLRVMARMRASSSREANGFVR